MRVQKVGVSGVPGTMEQANITVLAVSSQPHPAPATSLGVNHASAPDTRNSKAGLWGGGQLRWLSPTPTSSHPSPACPSPPQALPVPRPTSLWRSCTALGQGEAKRLLGRPDSAQI